MLNEIPLGALLIALAVLILLSGFFSGSETGLMALNRYRLRHMANIGHKGALRVSKLLERPDRLIGIILLGNNFLNILASALATIIAIRLLGEAGILAATVLLTLLLLIFGEVAPKTLAALHPERIAYPASLVLMPLLKLFYPLVWAVNGIANSLLKALRLTPADSAQQSLSPEELRTVVMEAGVMIPKRHQAMLLSILDLKEITVEDIMVPRHEVVGIDLEDDWQTIVDQLAHSQYTRLLVYRGDVDQVIGFLHMRKVANLMTRKPDFDRQDLAALIRDPYFIPEGTPLTTVLLNFQKERRRCGLVVDEYGDLMGLVTLEDILEEIVGEFTTDPLAMIRNIVPRNEGYLVDGSTHIRTLNRTLGWQLPTDGPRTINGLIMEYLENIPEPGTGLVVAGHPMEIVETLGNRVKQVLIYPYLESTQPEESEAD